MLSRSTVLLALVCGLAVPGTALAGGLDLPTLYGARYVGAGGGAVAQVDDASAVYHNPAGLGRIRVVNASNSLSVFFTNLQTSPDYANQNISTGTQVGPALLGALGWRLHPRVAIGGGVYPVGASGGHFEYTAQRGGEEREWLNEQQALAFELSPAVAFNLPGNLRLGAGYRITILKFERQLGDASEPRDVNIDLWGFDFTGMRLGAQWQPLEALGFGVSYRHRVTIEASADEGTLLGFDLQNVEAAMTVPSRLNVGVHGTLGELGLSAEYELSFNNQFDTIPVSGDLPAQDSDVQVDFDFHWQNSYALKLGGEYLIAKRWSVRAGYAYDSRATNPKYPSSFGSPPSDNHYLTMGAGYDHGHWRIDLAFSQKLPTTVELAQGEIADADSCRFCAKAGVYRSNMSALLLDFSVNLWEPDEAPAESDQHD